ncbi:hypothetical protein C3469_11185 [Mycobacterium kansasii]|uniref:hypothetical protein n=1 Tax=Mycobacterium kansasii TaxID=1768 RepID=UPI000CDCF744|nr:hypothetical protein [Mycobacterium kansasii]POY01239.1 hypothetical protein C3479_12790 [Mycobacterium kansasii]POY27497.1 hypothetical protein C3469_11185 [Mycobacterium kansasii]POY32718.1 hypothetical protein C3478_10195 [Mycobacterium kansasii]
MSFKPVARLALATVLLCPIAGVLATPAAAESPTTPCVSGETAELTIGDLGTLPLQQQDAPTTSCNSEKQACMSASVQIGIYGERYVPPDAAAMCWEAYRACIANQSDDGGSG